MGSTSPRDRLQRARLSLTGLSVGDALGERFFGSPELVKARVAERVLPPAPWRYTDDTQMALSVVEVLQQGGEIDADWLASAFARRFDAARGYGGGAQRLLQALAAGADWRAAAPAMFSGLGSFGNGAAMRVAPVGAYFAEDLDQVVENAARSASVTHAHPEGRAGAVAVAVAAAVAWQQAEAGTLDGDGLLAAVVERTPDGETRAGLRRAAALPAATPSPEVARQLGSGQNVTAQDTVPFALWCAARRLADFAEAFWTTVAGLGDRDTTCAIACGIVALSSRQVPERWIACREPLPAGFMSGG